MTYVRHAKWATKYSIILFILSFILISLVGGYIGVKGNQVRPKIFPTQEYEEVFFTSHARDQIPLTGWYFPAAGTRTAVIVHGWGGHRARLLDLAEYLQRDGINVLTFDLRGGSGRNSYGQHESGDLAGAITWLNQVKRTPSEVISVIGASMGGTASIVYASEHPLDKLVLLAPVVDIKEAKYLALKNRYFVWPNLYATGGSIVERIFFGVKPVNPIDIFYRVTTPTLIMHSRDDDIAPVKSIYELERQTKTHGQTNVTFQYFDSAGHKFVDSDKALDFPISRQVATFIKDPSSL